MKSRIPRSSTIPADLAAWRPQRFGKGNAKKVVDPLIEPFWPGMRVLVQVGLGDAARGPGGTPIEIVDEDGAPVADIVDIADIAEAIAAAVRTTSLVVDGYLTGQATRSTEGIELPGPRAPSAADMATQAFLGSAGQGRRRELARRQAAAAVAGPLAFVAIDVLLLDGEPILDIPLLERKRILEQILGESKLVRRTAFVRPPVGPWIGTWRSLGFGSIAYKGANSRYVPGGRNPAWALARIPPR
jgi:hypothetical protein